MIKSDYCKFHFWKNVRPKLYQAKYIPKLNSDILIPNIYKEIFKFCTKTQGNKILLAPVIKCYIKVLESLPTFDHYKNFLQIIRPFWKKCCPEFYNYFIEKYIDENKATCLTGWQNCQKLAHITTNNNIESFNRVIKAERTNHTKL